MKIHFFEHPVIGMHVRKLTNCYDLEEVCHAIIENDGKVFGVMSKSTMRSEVKDFASNPLNVDDSAQIQNEGSGSTFIWDGDRIRSDYNWIEKDLFVLRFDTSTDSKVPLREWRNVYDKCEVISRGDVLFRGGEEGRLPWVNGIDKENLPKYRDVRFVFAAGAPLFQEGRHADD